MPASSTTTSSSPMVTRPVKSPLSVQRPTLNKRKLSDVSIASPTSLDEVTSTSSADERVISPKKKAKSEDRSSVDLNKWERNVGTSITCALGMDDNDHPCRVFELEPIALSAAPVDDFAAEELQILRYFLL
ncbi:uncharacterized protein PHALS_12021 [Plasmopara halstedii]|uniref:Uncharacterized protein n=1 Tax=Plasmopara halstedii TaxID=4781 RepID=A0A0P1AL44_PLAHL|nr:uncharacterized protein PHALS_12021 [Plasmopara halstedii]CEG41689.1 hypothetical protein PHALS_12021 [Plasmopara halstedii]|eukprot:XP_024578058.1 hypothetical protein PHALS_12021 [Plasmopara halstedii]